MGRVRHNPGEWRINRRYGDVLEATRPTLDNCANLRWGMHAKMKQHAMIAWACCALLGACALSPKAPERVVMQGFSMAPPNEKDWLVVREANDVTVMGKLGRFSGETFTMQATIIKLPEGGSAEDLVQHVEAIQRKGLDPQRYRIFKLDVAPRQIHAQACALSRVEAAERPAAGATGTQVNMMLETMTLVCPHPDNRAHGLSMAYSHRHFPEDVDPQFAQDGALFVQSLKFEPL